MRLSPCFRFLRPCPLRVPQNLSTSKQTAYLQFYSAARSFSGFPSASDNGKSRHSLEATFKARGQVDLSGTSNAGIDLLQRPLTLASAEAHRDDIRKRINQLETAHALNYPRIKKDERAVTCAIFRSRYSFLKPEEFREAEILTLRGRIYSSRIAGSKLGFIDILQDGVRVQVLCNFSRLEVQGVSVHEFREFCQLARRGDFISITGSPVRTHRGELSLQATQLPIILTPCLASLPTTLEDPETRIRQRHADFLVNRRTAETLKLRSHIIQHMRNFLVDDDFLEVQTPILADGAGGAIARPFLTMATEFVERKLSLRIAPEIWLKRLVLGGMDRVFEIGPAFRNEGVDATHNPEFTTCEFYKAFADLEELITMTEHLISGLAIHVGSMIETQFTSLNAVDTSQYVGPFSRIEFIPALESAIGRKLPDLSSEDASEQLVSICSDLSISLPSSPSLPRLLDKLSSIYLESQCAKPTFIIHPPACLAPLAKSFRDPGTKQLVSARVELFILNREIANMYEEENSPFEQRNKFLQQAKWRDDENGSVIDGSYLKALEWGLPPTGGWGCGVDRLCMLFSGASRISDVLSFGSLRNVVGLGQGPF